MGSPIDFTKDQLVYIYIYKRRNLYFYKLNLPDKLEGYTLIDSVITFMRKIKHFKNLREKFENATHAFFGTKNFK